MADDTPVLVITGGSRGIGAATARLAAERGYRVVISYRENRAAADDVVRTIDAGGGEALAVVARVITAATLRTYAAGATKIEVHARALETARATSSVTTARRLCHFMGQVFVETAGFTTLVENLNYRSPARLDFVFGAVRDLDDAKMLIAKGPEAIANRVYANRLGNGDEASGDGWRYRGSGYKQLTGRANFRAIGRIVGMDLEGHPELVREPSTAARVAFAFWDACLCSSLADQGDVETITEKVNGPARLGLAERREATLKAMRIWK